MQSQPVGYIARRAYGLAFELDLAQQQRAVAARNGNSFGRHSKDAAGRPLPLRY
jgi:hypothetical protein